MSPQGGLPQITLLKITSSSQQSLSPSPDYHLTVFYIVLMALVMISTSMPAPGGQGCSSVCSLRYLESVEQ